MRLSSSAWAGSIPACAGEPAHATFQIRPDRVYPRVCGGTACRRGSGLPGYGLSPRVRGNRRLLRRPAGAAGSIPACAGEPNQIGRQSWTRWVYPRVCGGTCTSSDCTSTAPGLSPRVRGNPHALPHLRQTDGSIPACAGEPGMGGAVMGMRAVYPRVCGGTYRTLMPMPAAGGLSPRVRGNRPARVRKGKQLGSIPACAGEPVLASSRNRAARVYPRVCGGTSSVGAPISSQCGLSPRVRGNRFPYIAAGAM